MWYRNLKFAKIREKVSCKHRHFKVLARRHLPSPGHVNGRYDFLRGGVKNSVPSLQSTGILTFSARQPEKQFFTVNIRIYGKIVSCIVGVVIGNLG